MSVLCREMVFYVCYVHRRCLLYGKMHYWGEAEGDWSVDSAGVVAQV